MSGGEGLYRNGWRQECALVVSEVGPCFVCSVWLFVLFTLYIYGVGIVYQSLYEYE